MGLLGIGSPTCGPLQGPDEIKCLFYPSFLSLLPPSWSLSTPQVELLSLESSRPPRLPTGSLVLLRSAEKEQEMEQAAQAADVRERKAKAQEGSAWRVSSHGFSCLGVICLSISPGQGRQTEGKALGTPEPSFPTVWGTSQQLKCQSHFKLISLCIMFFKSFLNKNKNKSVSFPWAVGTGIRF